MRQFHKSLKFLIFLIFAISVFVSPKQTYAATFGDIFTSPDSVIVKVQEGVQYFFAFKVENKVSVLEKHAEKRLVKAQGYAEEGNNERVQNMVQSYQQIKERQNNLLEKIDDGEVLGMVAERTIEQQKTMEMIKTRIDEAIKQEVVQVQERVVNQVANRVVEVNGSEGATEFLNKVVHVWAPGTGPGGGEAGVVVVGGELQYAPGTKPGGQGGVVIVGGEMKFAPGTSEGGPTEPDIKTTEVKTGGDANTGGKTIEGGNQNTAPGTTSQGNTVEGGSQDFAPGTTSGGESGVAP